MLSELRASAVVPGRPGPARPPCQGGHIRDPVEADALLGPVTEIDGFLLACLIDASTGMVLAARQDGGGISLTAAAAGAADMAGGFPS